MDFSSLNHAQLYNLRQLYNNNPQMQNQLAPAEHQAYAREFAIDSPLTAAASLPFAIPAYTIAKYIGLPIASNSRSAPSIDEMLSGYKGLGQGLLQAGTQKLTGLLGI